MEISVLVGNGVDLSNGLHTSYTDFFKAKIEKKTDSNNRLYQSFQKQKRWSDMEEDIGKFSVHYEDDVSKFEQDKEELQDDLLDFLQDQQNKISASNVDEKKQNFYDFVNNLDAHLSTQEDKERFRATIAHWKSIAQHQNYEWELFVNFITLNYTSLLEQKLYSESDDEPLDSSQAVAPLFYNAALRTPDVVLHPHGTIDDYMIFGVDNISQLENHNADITKDSVKSELIKISESNDFGYANELLSDSNLIVVIGASLGKTDNHWINGIVMQLVENPDALVIIDQFIKQKPPRKSALAVRRSHAESKEPFVRYVRSHEEVQTLVENKIGGLNNLLARILVGNFYPETSNIVNLDFR